MSTQPLFDDAPVTSAPTSVPVEGYAQPAAVTSAPISNASAFPAQPMYGSGSANALAALPTEAELEKYSPQAITQQSGTSQIAHQILENHKAHDLGNLTSQLTQLVNTAQGLANPKQASSGGLLGRLHAHFQSEKAALLSHIQSIEAQIQKLSAALSQGLAAEKQHVQQFDGMQNQMRSTLPRFQEGLARCQQWLGQAQSLPVPQNPEERLRLQNLVQKFGTWQEDFQNAMVFVQQQLASLEAEKQVSRNNIDACERVLAFTIPALENVAAQQVLLVEQKKTLGAIQAGKDAFSAALQASSEMLGENLVLSSQEASQSVFSVDELEKAQNTLNDALNKVRENQQQVEMQRQLDSQKRVQMSSQLQRLGLPA